MKYLWLLIFIGLTEIVCGKTVLTQWETKYKTDNIELQYRWVLVGDTLTTRELKAVFLINANEKEILNNFYSSERFQLWATGSKECEIYKNSDLEWLTYTMIDIPRPFKQQDLITRHKVLKREKETCVRIESIPDYLPNKEGVSRIKNYEGYWLLKEQISGLTRIEFYTTSFTEPVFPRFIQDPIIQWILAKSFEKLKSLSETKK